MIALHGVTVFRPGTRGKDAILHEQDAVFAARSRVGILAPAGSGRTTLVRVLAGISLPDRGHVHLTGRVSWPIGYAGMLHPMLTLEQNLRHIAELIGARLSTMQRQIAWVCGDADVLGKKVQDLTPGDRANAALALSLAIPADHYVADEKISVGDENARGRADALLKMRLEGAALLYMSRNTTQLKHWCTDFRVLMNGKLIWCPDPETGQKMIEIASERVIQGGADRANV